MKKKLGKLLLLGLSLAAIGCSATPKSSDLSDGVKVGLICLHDDSSTYDKNFIDGLRETFKAIPEYVKGEPIIKTGVPEDNTAFTAARELVKQGCNVIFADSFGHEDFLINAAKQNPNVTFCHATGTKAKVNGVKNFHNAFASIYEGRYMAGYAAGLKLKDMIEAGQLKPENYRGDDIILGYIGAFPYAEVISGYTSWYLGVREVVPNVVMDVLYTSSWYDFEAEKSGANALKMRGAAIISQHADSMGAPGECELMGIPNVTYNISTIDACPKTYLAHSKIDWSPYYTAVIKAVKNGTAIEHEVNNNYTGTIGTGSVQYNCAVAEYNAELKRVEAELVNGSRKVFDCSKFTVKGEHINTYLADVDDMGDYKPDTEVIKTEGGITFFDESSLRSAPYFDIIIDGVNILNN